ncbi:Tethering factor for nuclear proteasome sts1 [Coemansia javaensis]|uniref:Tethering factor for nuclear proteasome STS1 n=1 Tax=Coemansia javaensis TaxID=2761396 RepID=A0A9W8H7D7_9FUNG|nr:Tethering factor for nuclear proteasome sts1 [Coemansia javaensis]
MSQQGPWKASALAATFASNPGFNGAAWGAARAPLHLGCEMGFGLGFAQAPAFGAAVPPPGQEAHVGGAEAGRRAAKRKAVSEDESMDDGSSPTPEPPGGHRGRRAGEDPVAAAIVSSSNNNNNNGSGALAPSRHYAAVRKRTRMAAADAAVPSEVSLDKLLEPLESKDLRQLLDTLVAQNPQLAAQVRQLVPKPTVKSACSQLVRLEQRLQAAFPYNKSGPVSDDYAFHRVRPALDELRDTIAMYLDHFTHHGLQAPAHSTAGSGSAAAAAAAAAASIALSHPAEWFELLAQATDVAMRMPKWDRPENNAARRESLRQLANGWLRAIAATARWTEDGHIVGRDMLERWAHQLEHFYTAADEPALFEPALQAFHHSFGRSCARFAASASATGTAAAAAAAAARPPLPGAAA